MRRLTIKVPSGIGDISWILSKLSNAKDVELYFEIADGWPHRSHQLLELIPWVKGYSYGDFSYSEIFAFERMNKDLISSWESIVCSGLEVCPLSANYHLECGKGLESWLPDLKVDYHYEIATTVKSKLMAHKYLEHLSQPVVCMSAASYRGSESWKTWGLVEWTEFLYEVHSARPECSFVLLGGFWDDLTSGLAEFIEEQGYLGNCLVGRTRLGTAIEVIRSSDAYLGFPSGLGVLATVVHRPVFMMWPEHLRRLSTSWVPPFMLMSGDYQARSWESPEKLAFDFLGWMDSLRGEKE